MKEQELLELLANQENDERKIPPALTALVEGRLSPHQVQELEREAENDPQLAQLIQAFRPLESEQEDQIVQALVAQGKVESPGAKVIKLFTYLTPILAAAAVAFWVSLPANSTLPGYGVETNNGSQQFRSADASQRLKYHPEDELEFILRPEKPVSEMVLPLAFLEQDGRFSPLELPFQVSEEGSVRIHGQAQALFGSKKGAMTLYIVVLPQKASLQDASWQSVSKISPKSIKKLQFELL